MNNIDLTESKTKHFAFKKMNYKQIEEKKNRIKVYNHKYYLDSKFFNGEKWTTYYQQHKEIIKKQNDSKKPKLPRFFEREYKSINIDFS